MYSTFILAQAAVTIIKIQDVKERSPPMSKWYMGLLEIILKYIEEMYPEPNQVYIDPKWPLCTDEWIACKAIQGAASIPNICLP